MKHSTLIALAMAVCLTLLPTKKSHAVIWVVVKEAAKKVIKAIDLQIQRIQNKTIGLQNAQRTVENTLSRLKLNEISDWAKRQKELYGKYYEELNKVRSLVAAYKDVSNILQKQIDIVDAYKEAFPQFRRDGHFSPDEIQQMAEVYDGILTQCAETINGLSLIIKSFFTQMDDAARIELIHTVGTQVDVLYNDIQRYNYSNRARAVNKATSATEAAQLKALYGLD